MQFFLNNKLYLLHLKWFRIQISYSCLFYDNRKKMQWVIYGGDNFFWQRLTSFIQKGPYNFLSKLWHQLVAKKKMISWFHDLLLPITFQNSTLENQEWYFRVIKQSQTNKLIQVSFCLKLKSIFGKFVEHNLKWHNQEIFCRSI